MAQSQELTTNERTIEYDEIIADVMPRNWAGHARIEIHERGYEGKKRHFAERLAARLLSKHDISAETAAEKAIEMAEKKLD